MLGLGPRGRRRSRGFTPRNIFRMKLFYETSRNKAMVTRAVSQLPWTQHRIILKQSKRAEEREFYLRMESRNVEQTRVGAPVQSGALRTGCFQSA